MFRLLLVSVAGLAAFAVLVSWRAQTLVNAQYQELPKSHIEKKQDIIRPETGVEKQKRELEEQLKK